MPHVEKLGVLLEPTKHDFENFAVLNPGSWQDGNTVHLFYRAVDEQHRSSIGYARLEGPATVVERWEKPIITRDFDYESMGVEDPRITKIEDTFYLFYVAHDGKNAITAYATGDDLFTLKKRGVLSPRIPYRRADRMFQKSRLKDSYSFFAAYYEKEMGENVLLWHKDVFLFPEKIRGRFALLHRVLPDIQLMFFSDFKELTASFWTKHLKELSEYVVLENKHWFETRNIGGGCVPIATDEGWLLIFHGVEAKNKGRVYHACAALLDRENPLKVMGRLHEPLFSPEEPWEKRGHVPNVVFPTGTAIFGDTLYIYYGAADKRIAVAAISLSEISKEIKDPTKRHDYEAKK